MELSSPPLVMLVAKTVHFQCPVSVDQLTALVQLAMDINQQNMAESLNAEVATF